MLLISLRRLSNAQKNNLKQYYKVLIFDQRLHLRKTISQLVQGCDVLLIELNLSRVFSISRNIVYKWLKQQNIVDIATTFIYESSKYKNLFRDNINFFIRKLPMLFDRELEAVIDDQAYLDQETKSIYRPEPEKEEEEDTTVSAGGEIPSDPLAGFERTCPSAGDEDSTALSTVQDNVKRIDDIQKQIDAVIQRLKALEVGEGEPATQSGAEPIVEKPVERKYPFKPQGRRDSSLQLVTKELKVKQGSKKFIVIESVDGDDAIIKEFPYRNAIEKRRAKKEAERTLLTLQKG